MKPKILYDVPTKLDPDDPPYFIRNICNKGQGAVATSRIEEGTLIASEQPIFTANFSMWTPANITYREILEIINQLCGEDQQTFFGLQNAHPKPGMDVLYTLIQSNVLFIDDETTGIFLGLAKFNHACNSNCHAEWNPNTNEMTVIAIRDIQPGEEINICYSRSTPMPREERRQELLKIWNFECLCDMCVYPIPIMIQSELRLHTVQKIYSSPMLHLQGPLAKLHDICRILILLKQEGLHTRVADLFYSMAADTAALCSDLARCKFFSHCVALARTMIMGAEHPKVLMATNLAKNPSSHPLFGTWTKWLTRTIDIPRTLTGDAFQQWLWRNNDTSASGRLLATAGADLRDDWIFIPFQDLPKAGVFDTDFFYQCNDSQYPLFNRNWCFLGQIVQVHEGSELVVEVQSKGHRDGDDTIPVRFRDATQGQEYFNRRVPEPGATIAIIYPVKRIRTNRSAGLKVSYKGEFTIFPAGLDKILHVSDQVQRYSNMVPDPEDADALVRKCHTCGTTPAMIRCELCEMFFYCSENCRQAAQGGIHEDEVCKLLQDGDLKALFFTNWDEYDGLVVFPSV
ncbi:hypothetical protein BGZ63DRAFT_377379 [Mariannaea sp. PMI_226]|nr:hypothetical protein BGZ63DRAFT_377379 [Mariannaea sp. PMI_226]